MFAYKLTLTPQQMQSMMAGLPKWVASATENAKLLNNGAAFRPQRRLLANSI
jgi:hypothetical protein